MSGLTRDGTVERVSETKISGANGDREIFIFPVQLTMSRVGNHIPPVARDGYTNMHTSYYMVIVIYQVSWYIIIYAHNKSDLSNPWSQTQAPPFPYHRYIQKNK